MVREAGPVAIAHALRAGRPDGALVHEYDFVPAAREPGPDIEPLFEEAVYLAAPASAGLGAPGGHPDQPGAGTAPPRRSNPVHRRTRNATPRHDRTGLTGAGRRAPGARSAPRIRHRGGEFATVLASSPPGRGVRRPAAEQPVTPVPPRSGGRAAGGTAAGLAGSRATG
ncbi:hypothetical protein GCM10010347_30420 [Streptomyces cirratus]|uniref:Uncharacterized protein n=1 Tax=Streptomyces cirratus TaxID=68187 RepID=A0ABQ3EWV4_9ACTN|nr:hypothetical protein [Streptomyces cirratus]GHB58145.1 hypothetical protein GCM10010347_30420 [Streptomyces cirratus]